MTLPDERIKLPLKLQVYHTDVCGNRTHEGETDMHPEDWVFNNNAERHNQISCGDPESEEHKEHECICIEDTDDFEFKWERNK